jgi:hypothetical protein
VSDFTPEEHNALLARADGAIARSRAICAEALSLRQPPQVPPLSRERHLKDREPDEPAALMDSGVGREQTELHSRSV